MRQANLERKTKETEIELEIKIEGSGDVDVKTPVPFLNHMLELFAHHGQFDLYLQASGDIEVDAHHLVEDIGIVLGKALYEAAGDKRGINRYGDQFVPMDEALLHTVVDFGGRFFLQFKVTDLKDKAGEFDTELVQEFFRALAANGKFNLHIRKLAGSNTHHIIEGIFKSFGRSLAKALTLDKDREDIPSTKGKL